MHRKLWGAAALAAGMTVAVIAPTAHAAAGDGGASDAASPEDAISDTEYYVSKDFTTTVKSSAQVPNVLGDVVVGQWGDGGGDRVGFVDPGTGVAYIDPDSTFGSPSVPAPAILPPKPTSTAVATAVVGNWCGTGDVIGYVTGATFHLACTPGSAAEFEFTFGRAGDEVLVGDWDADGRDTVAVRRGNHYYLSNALRSGPADTQYTFGRTTDQALSGDWDGDGLDTVAVRRGNLFFAGSLAGDTATLSTTFGRFTDIPFAVDTDTDGTDELAVRRDPGLSSYVETALSNMEQSAEAAARAKSAQLGTSVLPAWPGTHDRLGAEFHFSEDADGLLVVVVVQYSDPMYVAPPEIHLRPSDLVGGWKTVFIQGPGVE